MTIYAYLRVSTDMQDVNSQKLGVLEYCAAQKLGMPDMVSRWHGHRITPGDWDSLLPHVQDLATEIKG